jgi:hypothetical protein
MADIALTWIAPFVDPRGSNLWVLNPGTAEATITIYWFEAAGVLADKGEMTVGAGCLEGFGWWSTHPSGLNDPAPPDPPEVVCWLRLENDRPVVPYGTTVALPEETFVVVDFRPTSQLFSDGGQLYEYTRPEGVLTHGLHPTQFGPVEPKP